MSDSVPSPQHFTGHLLRRAQQVHVAAWAQHVSSTVTSVQFAALSVLSHAPGMSQASMGGELGLDRATIADLVRRMEDRGHVARTADARDARRKVVSVTEAGRQTLHELLPRVESLELVLTDGLSPDERSQLRAMLERVVDQDPTPLG